MAEKGGSASTRFAREEEIAELVRHVEPTDPAWIEQEIVEVPLTATSWSVKRGPLMSGLLLLATGAFLIISNDWRPGLGYPSWYWLGGVAALLALIGFMTKFGFWMVAAWVIGVPLGLVALLIIFSPQIWSNLQETFNAPLTFGGAFVLMLIFAGWRS